MLRFNGLRSLRSLRSLTDIDLEPEQLGFFLNLSSKRGSDLVIISSFGVQVWYGRGPPILVETRDLLAHSSNGVEWAVRLIQVGRGIQHARQVEWSVALVILTNSSKVADSAARLSPTNTQMCNKERNTRCAAISVGCRRAATMWTPAP